MRILMKVGRMMQDAGRELPLRAGEVYDLPDVVAQAFIATGVATRVATVPEVKPLAAAEAKPSHPETKPQAAPEMRRIPRAS